MITLVKVEVDMVVVVMMMLHLAADDDTVATGLLLLVDVLVLGAALVRLVGELAACTSAVELDAVTLARDSVALACAA